MSVVIFELKQEHINLLKHLRWSIKDNNLLVSTESLDEEIPSFGANNLYEGIDLILNGKPENFDPFNTHDMEVYSTEKKEMMDKLFSELPTALDVILYTGSFVPGTYKTKFHDRNWKKIN